MTTFNYTEADLRLPTGDNGLTSYALFFQRMLYKEAIFPSSLVAPLDTWYGKQLYGVVDQTQNSIIAAPENLTPIPTAVTPNLVALNFMVEAFEAFVAHMRKGVVVEGAGAAQPPSNARRWKYDRLRLFVTGM